MKSSRGFLFMLFLALFTPTLFAAVTYTYTGKAVYYGSESRIVSPAVAEIQKVYDQMPSYQEAMQHPDGSAKRTLGLKKASDEFRDIVAKVCKEKKYEFATEKGCLSGEDSATKKSVDIPDITQDAIKAIPAK